MTTENQPSPENPSSVDSKAPEGIDPQSTPTPISSGSVWRILILAGLVAGLGTFALTEGTRDLISQNEDLINALEGKDEAQARESHRQDIWIEYTRSMIFNGTLGALVGLLLGLAGGRVQAPARWSFAIAALGLLIGAALGVGMSLLIVPWHQAAIDSAYLQDHDDMISPLFATIAIWGVLGILGGLAFGWSFGGSRRQIFRAVEGGVIGAIIAAFVYQFVGALLLTSTQTDYPLASEWPGRLLAALCLPIFLAFGIAMAAPQRRVRKEPAKGPIPDASTST